MIDLHTHTLFSDGLLLPSELVYRAKFQGYTAIALTDHGDASRFDFVIPRIKLIAEQLTEHYGIQVVPGIEITYVPPALIKQAVETCRNLGAKIVVVHGETVAETVPKGTNKAAILSGADILAHPGYITDEEMKLAREKNIYIEITTRNGHKKTNKHVADLASKHKAKMLLNTDTHIPENILTTKKIKEILKTAGLSNNYYDIMQANAKELLKNAGFES